MKPLELLHEILTRLPAQPNAWIVCTRTELTRKLCHHPNRPGSVRTEDLSQLLPKLVTAGLACELPRPGKPPALVFRPVTAGERRQRVDCLARRRFIAANSEHAPRSDGDAPAWLQEEALLERVGPHGYSPVNYMPLHILEAISSTETPRNKADVPVPALSPSQTP